MAQAAAAIPGGDWTLPVTPAGITVWSGVGCVLLAAVLAAPLATYAILLALFGLVHVITELRYVDQRFGPRIGLRLLPWIAAGLAAAVVARGLSVAGVIPRFDALTLELAAGLAIAAAAVVVARRHRAAIGAGLGLTALCAGLWPLDTLLVIALAHNLTPLAFVAEALPAGDRGRAVAVLCVPFLVIPAVLASGAMQEFGLALNAWTPFGIGPIARHQGVLTPPFVTGEAATALFAGAVFAQGMHYFATIVVLPRLAPDGAAPVLPWPSPTLFWSCMGATALASLALYSWSFADARAWYGLPAALHSWAEGPVLLLALAGALSAARK